MDNASSGTERDTIAGLVPGLPDNSTAQHCTQDAAISVPIGGMTRLLLVCRIAGPASEDPVEGRLGLSFDGLNRAAAAAAATPSELLREGLRSRDRVVVTVPRETSELRAACGLTSGWPGAAFSTALRASCTAPSVSS
eukprot:scaffold3899_cov393-Prasinococcus_capsulatus_cf.AAC.1